MIADLLDWAAGPGFEECFGDSGYGSAAEYRQRYLTAKRG